MKLKVLPLENWMKHKQYREDCNPKNIKLQLIPEYIDAIYKYGDMSWFVVDGQAYAYDVKQFNYELKLANTKIYSAKEYDALCLLRIAKVLNKAQLNELYIYECYMTSRITYRNALKFRIRVTSAAKQLREQVADKLS